MLKTSEDQMTRMLNQRMGHYFVPLTSADCTTLA